MKTAKTRILSVLILFAAASRAGIIAGGQEKEAYRTLLNPPGKLGVVRHPGPLDMGARREAPLQKLPSYDPSSTQGWQVDLRGRDLSTLDLGDRTKDLLYADFDSRTIWPKVMPTGFESTVIMERGKNPGLGVRSLHARGITGKGIGIAIIDQGLLVDHVEYEDRLRSYEEIHCADDVSPMHGPAVASIAVGKTVGVAPEADLYYIAETHGSAESGQFVFDFQYLAQSIDRILEIDRELPTDRKIRVLSIFVGWNPLQKGYAETNAAVERAKKVGIFIVSSSVSATSGGKFNFHGLGRSPLDDPDSFVSFKPGLWWLDQFYARSESSPPLLLVPMDSRATAGPTGTDEYAFYRQGGWSWSIPYIAGLYALACQVKPDITPEAFWATALETGDSVVIPARRAVPPDAEIAAEVAKMVDLSIARMREMQKDVPLEKILGDAYSRIAGKKIDAMDEADFRSWAAGAMRERVLNDTKPKILKSIVNPMRLIEELKKK